MPTVRRSPGNHFSTKRSCLEFYVPGQGVNPWIQSGWRTSALMRIPDSSRTSREVRKVPEDIRHASQSLESAVIWRPGTLGVLGRGCPLARGRMRVKELAGKTAFVTGAASGIGLGIATAFAQAGAKVMLCDIAEAALSVALKQLRITNVDVDGVKADVSLKA